MEKVNIPKDRDGNQKNFGFVTFRHGVSVSYALDLFECTSIYDRALTIKARQSSSDQTPPSILRKMNNTNTNEGLPFGNQVVMGYQMPPMGYNMLPMFVSPGMMPYTSQNHMIPFSHGKEDRHPNRNHPYARDRENNRDRDRRRDYNRCDNRAERDHRGREQQRSSNRSHRSNDNRSGRHHR